jgi:hypothetical protein
VRSHSHWFFFFFFFFLRGGGGAAVHRESCRDKEEMDQTAWNGAGAPAPLSHFPFSVRPQMLIDVSLSDRE